MRYGFYEEPFLLSKFVTSLLYYLEMGRQMVIIEFKYGFRGNFKPIIKISAIIGTLTLIEMNCKEEIKQFIIENFKLTKVDAPQMYDLFGEFNQTIKRNKKYSTFHHESQSHIEYFANQMENQVEDTLAWEFGMLKKPQLNLKSIKRYRSWEIKR